MNGIGGRALLQWYKDLAVETDGELETTPPQPKKRKKREVTKKPLILAICTPLMARAHTELCQAGEITFCDASSSMDRFNTIRIHPVYNASLFWCAIAVAMVSDETEQTMIQAMEMIKVLPTDAFYGNGPDGGPAVFMIDDSIVDHAALSRSWPSAKVLLCTFHFFTKTMDMAA